MRSISLPGATRLIDRRGPSLVSTATGVRRPKGRFAAQVGKIYFGKEAIDLAGVGHINAIKIVGRNGNATAPLVAGNHVQGVVHPRLTSRYIESAGHCRRAPGWGGDRG
jgi:hypothetical protein